MSNKFDLTPHISKADHVPAVDAKGVHRSVGGPSAHDRTPIGEHLITHGYDGGKPPQPKNHGNANQVHGSAHHVGRDGVTYQSVTPTQVAMALSNAPLAEKNPLNKPPQMKVMPDVAISPSMRSRTIAGADMTSADHVKLGKACLAEAIKSR
jgi:hypothetical protein